MGEQEIETCETLTRFATRGEKASACRFNGVPMIKDEIDKAEIQRPETRSDGDDEHSDLEEDLYLLPLALSKQ